MRVIVILVAVTPLLGGCRLMSGETIAEKRSPLQPARPSPESVTMEIIWARFPAGDPALNNDAWREIDESQIDPSVRLELSNNGFRAGVIRGQLPDAIARALNQGLQAPAEADSNGLEKSMQIDTDPVVHGRVLRLRKNQRSEILASEIYAAVPLLISQGRELGGRTYQQAQAIYALRINPRLDRSVTLELTPELHHGPARFRYTGEEGVLRQELRRDREVFDRLRITTQLGAGELLVLMSLPDARSRLGHYFHTVESADGPQQKLILIRLADMPPSDTFAAISR